MRSFYLIAILLTAALGNPCSFLFAATVPQAQTPPMGWNDYNHFNMNISDADIRAAADALVSTGMRDAGYVYVNIDDGWEGERDATGVLHANSRFPDMKALSDYVHARGLKLGIYSSPGPWTCGGMVGSYQHEEQDAKTFASWGVDYLKYDLCFSYISILDKEAHGNPQLRQAGQRQAYAKMHNALLSTGRPMVFSMCQYGWDSVWEWGTEVGGNLWRTTADIKDNYDRMSVLGFSQAGISKYAGPGHWNDPDMLEVGNGGMTRDEYQTHMSLWSILAAPLIAGNDLTKMSEETKSILMNREVIAVDQDALGIAGDRVWQQGPIEVWTKPLSGGDVAVAIFNRNDSSLPVSIDLDKLGLKKSLKARDLWQHKELGTVNGALTAEIAKHGVLMLRLELLHK